MNLLNYEQKVLFNKALELHNKGKFQKAIILYSKLIKKINNNFELLFLIGTAYVQSGKTSNGIEYLKKSLTLNPDNVSAHVNLGNALSTLKHFNEAIASYNKAIKINPDYADAYNNRGIVLKEMRRFNEAIASYDKAIEIKPNHFFAHNNKGVALKEIKFFNEAIESYDKAIEIKPNYTDALNNRGNVFKNLKLYDKALSDYVKVMQLNPNYDYILGKVLHLKMFLCDWKDFNILSEKINEAINEGSKATEPLPYLGIADKPGSCKLVSEIFVKDKFLKSLEIQTLLNYNHKKPKIAYFSADFHNHPTLHLMMDVFKNHDGSKFDFFAFSFGPDINDAWRKEVKNYFFEFKDISKFSDKEVLDYVKDLEIDIAIDLKGFTSNTRSGIFTNRVAPIQINYLGYPGTTSLEYMDYIIADDVIIPNENFKYYSEKVLHMPQCYQANMKQRKISNKEFKRSDFELPEDAIVYCSFNNNYKITPYIFDAWMNILNQVDNSVLWILKTNDIASRNLKEEAQKKGVNPNRIIFASYLTNEEHLKRIPLADLFLDTYPYNAHTTASDAIRMGIPIITLTGNSFASRVGSSILTSVNMKELITLDKENYQKLAIELGRETNKIKTLKDKLRDTLVKSSLFDSLKFTKNLEALYSKLLRN